MSYTLQSFPLSLPYKPPCLVGAVIARAGLDFVEDVHLSSKQDSLTNIVLCSHCTSVCPPGSCFSKWLKIRPSNHPQLERH